MIEGLDMVCGSRDADGEGRGVGLLFLMNMCFKLPALLSLLLECLDHSPACFSVSFYADCRLSMHLMFAS